MCFQPTPPPSEKALYESTVVWADTDDPDQAYSVLGSLCEAGVENNNPCDFIARAFSILSGTCEYCCRHRRLCRQLRYPHCRRCPQHHHHHRNGITFVVVVSNIIIIVVIGSCSSSLPQRHHYHRNGIMFVVVVPTSSTP